jgi:NADH-quinone oxidoreductase subunit J
MFQFVFFYLISSLLLISAFLVITVQNPIHSVLFLVLVFVEAAILLLLLEIEFLPLIFIVIYVGAIAILFLFVVMMIDIKPSKTPKNSFRYFSIGGFLGVFFLINLFSLINESSFLSNLSSELNYNTNYINWILNFDSLNNLNCIGQFLYTNYFVHFLMSGFLLLIGMMGPILLTLSVTKNSKNQLIFKQLSKQSSFATFLTTF